jgi:small subunit ribosomal protein S15
VLTPIITQQNKGKIMSINLKNKQELVKKFGSNDKDTGSTSVQVAMLSQKINELTEHLKSNQKDFATKRGLLMMVGKRKRLLSYLKSQNIEEYRSLVKKLNLRG